MRQLLLLTLLASAAWGQKRVEIRENEIWFVSKDQAKQLTRDGRSKLQVLHSRDFDRIAYYDVCREGENCTPSVIVLDRDGNRLQSFHPSPSALGDPGPCGSILKISWAAEERAIGVECHENPSLSEYVEIDLSSGKTLHDLAGIGFTPSPTANHVAYIAPLIHFAPPYMHSNYLLIDGVTTYPLPKGRKPQLEKEGEPAIDAVRREGSKYVGIHEFVSDFFWSPDSTRVAFVDCISDWIETGVDVSGARPIGDAVNDRCSIAAVSLDGTVTLFPLTADVPARGGHLPGAPITWS